MRRSNKINIAISVLLCLPIVFIVHLFLSYTSHNATAKDIYQIKITMPDSSEIILNETEDIQFYLDTMLDAKKVDVPPRSIEGEVARAMVIGYQKLDKQSDYILFPSLDPKECFFMSTDGNCLLIGEEAAKQLLLRQELEFIYNNSTLPVLHITASGIKSQLSPVSYEWKYKKSDGGFYTDNKSSLRGEVNEYELFADMINTLEFAVSPDIVKTTVYNEDGTAIYTTDTSDISQLSFGTDMKLRIVVSAEWTKKEKNAQYGKAEYEIFARYDIPAKFTISSLNAKPGDVLLLTASFLDIGEAVELETTLSSSPLMFREVGSKNIALIPIAADNEPGVYSMKLKAGGRETKFDINITKLDSKVQHLTISKTLSDSARTQFRAMITAAAQNSVQPAYIQSGVAFFKPLTGTVKYAFADEMFYDPNPALIYNYGNYYTISSGSSIKSGEKGKIVFAGENEITGKTIIIDHGNGIQTLYGHLGNISTVNAKLGAVVQKGVVIGTSGNTGYTAENSFLFCVIVNGVLVNPNQALETGIIFE